MDIYAFIGIIGTESLCNVLCYYFIQFIVLLEVKFGFWL